MVYMIIGVPGAGKTYLAVKTIRDICLDKKNGKCKYKHVYTNINGLKYDELNKIANQKDFVKPFEFQDLKKEIIREYTLHEQTKHTPIQDYDSFAKSQGIYQNYLSSIIFIDECHLYFETKATPELVRFLSYHRHFDLDIYLITQNKNLIDKKYLVFIEKMYKGMPSAKRFFSNVFRYQIYASYQEYKQNIIENISVKADKKIFELYDSGSKQVGQSALSKFALPLLGMALLVFLLYKYFIASRFEDKVASNSNQTHIASKNNPVLPNSSSKSNPPSLSVRKIVFINCLGDDCKIDGFNGFLSVSSILKILKKFDCNEIVTDFKVQSMRTYLMECDRSIENLFNKRSSDEKSTVANIFDNSVKRL